jgi:hypothetical protein
VDAVAGRQAQVGERGVEVLGQTGYRRRVAVGEALDDRTGQRLAGLRGRRVAHRPDVGEHLGRRLVGQLGPQVPSLWYQQRIRRLELKTCSMAAMRPGARRR